MDQIYNEVIERGWFNAPAPKKVAKRAAYWQERTIVTAAAVMVQYGYNELISTGGLAAGTPPPPEPRLDTEHPEVDYADAYRVWRDEQLAGADPDSVSRLDQVKGWFLSDTQAGAALAG
jgi:hypothetical protein